AFQAHTVFAVLSGAAVISGQQIDKLIALVVFEAHREFELVRIMRKVVQEQHGIVAPVVADGKYRRITGLYDFELPPTDFGYFLAHSDDVLGPVQQWIWITPLFRGIDVLEAVGSFADDGHNRFIAFGEAAIRLSRPLHRRPATGPFPQ